MCLLLSGSHLSTEQACSRTRTISLELCYISYINNVYCKNNMIQPVNSRICILQVRMPVGPTSSIRHVRHGRFVFPFWRLILILCSRRNWHAVLNVYHWSSYFQTQYGCSFIGRPQARTGVGVGAVGTSCSHLIKM